MKKTINGRRYNTETAIKIGERRSRASSSLQYWTAVLYRTKATNRAKFFLAGHGNPMSRFGQACGLNSWTPGGDLIPLTRKQAREWAAEFLSPDIVDENFGD